MALMQHDLVIDQGATFRLPVRWEAAGQAVNLTGATPRLQIRRTYDAATPLLDLTPGAGLALTPAEGRVDVLMTAQQTAALPAGRWVYDLEIALAGGDVVRLLAGRATVTPEVTR